MIIEHAVLNVIEGKRDAFEAAFAKALPLISETPGFIGLELRPCIEADGKYLLLVQWRSVEDHTTGFRRTSRYDEWRRLASLLCAVSGRAALRPGQAKLLRGRPIATRLGSWRP